MSERRTSRLIVMRRLKHIIQPASWIKKSPIAVLKGSSYERRTGTRVVDDCYLIVHATGCSYEVSK